MSAGPVLRSQTERMWMIGGAVLAVLVVVIGYFFLIGPQRDETANYESQAADAQAQNSLLQTKIASLRKQNVDIARYRTELSRARQALPATSGLADLLRTLQSIGGQTQTSVDSFTVNTPVDVTSVGDDKATPSPAATQSKNPNAAAIAAAPAAPAVTQHSGGGIYSLPITSKVTGSTGALNNFLSQLQSVQPRAVLITGITQGVDVTGAHSGDARSLQLTMSAFVAPAPAADTTGATPAPTAGR